MPAQSMDLTDLRKASDGNGKSKLLQEIFLSAVRKSGSPVTMFLVNGVMLQGEIAAFDLFCMLLVRDGMIQPAYKHPISPVQPLSSEERRDGKECVSKCRPRWPPVP